MLEYNEIRYAAIITISLPGGEQAQYQITLAPPEQIGAGQGKALRDCTLAELQAYANQLEAETLAAWQDINLIELADHSDTEVVVRVINDTGQALPAKDVLLGHIVVKPAIESETETESETEPETETETRAAAAVEIDAAPDESTETPAVAAPTGTADVVDSGVSPVVDTPAGSADEEETAEPAEPAAAEPVVTPAAEEPAAVAPAPVAPAVEPDTTALPRRAFRIAGRRRPLGAKTWAAADILINEPAFRDAQAHSLTSMHREVAGMLIGPRPEQKEDGRWIVHVSDTIIAQHTEMRGASVTYTPESWRYVHDKLAERYPNEEAVIVGWYHTHPGFGIFLSGMDLFIHQNFFIQPWHIALVLDPQARRSGFFCWDQKQTQVRPYEFPWPSWALDSW